MAENPCEVRSPGDRSTPDDVREILYRMVSNIVEIGLRRLTDLDESDDQRLYEMMAKKIACSNFLCVPSENGVDPHQSNICYINSLHEAYERDQDVDVLSRELQRMARDPVKCMKGIFRVAKISAERIKASATTSKWSWAQYTVEAISLALETYERHTRKPISSYVKIWEMDETMTGGITNVDAVNKAGGKCVRGER